MNGFHHKYRGTQRLLFLLIFALPWFSVQAALTIQDYQVVSSTRLSRYVFEYTLRANLVSTDSKTYTNARAELASVPSNFQIVEGVLLFGSIAPGATVASNDDFTIRIDRSVSSPPLTAMIWDVAANELKPPTPTPGPTSSGIYMNIDNLRIKGESKSSSHKDWVEVLSLNEGAMRPGSTSTGGGGGKVNIQDISLTKYIDSSSIGIRSDTASGNLSTDIKIEVIKQCGSDKFITEYTMNLSKVLFTSVSAGGSGGEDRLTENVTINFARIDWAYTPIAPDCSAGPVQYGGWDLELNAP